MKCNINECNIYDLMKVISSKYVAFILIELYEKDLKYSNLSGAFLYLTNTQLSRCLNKCITQELIEKRNDFYSLTKYGKEVTYHLIALENIYLKK